MGRCGLGPWKCRLVISTDGKGCAEIKEVAGKGGRSEGCTWAVAGREVA